MSDQRKIIETSINMDITKQNKVYVTCQVTILVNDFLTEWCSNELQNSRGDSPFGIL